MYILVGCECSDMIYKCYVSNLIKYLDESTKISVDFIIIRSEMYEDSYF